MLKKNIPVVSLLVSVKCLSLRQYKQCYRSISISKTNSPVLTVKGLSLKRNSMYLVTKLVCMDSFGQFCGAFSGLLVHSDTSDCLGYLLIIWRNISAVLEYSLFEDAGNLSCLL